MLRCRRWQAWLVAAGVGCGRIGFDPDALGPPLVITQQDNQAFEIAVDDRFSLRFAETHDWCAVDWRDATAPSEPLVGISSRLEHSVLQALLGGFNGSNYFRPGDGTGRMFAVVEQNAAYVQFQTASTFQYAQSVVRVTFDHRIDRDGVWQITTTLTEVGGGPSLEFIEIGDSHVNDVLAWTITGAADGYTWRRDGAGPQATLQVVFAAPVGGLRMDEPNNGYFTELGLTLPATRTWTVVLWPPT